MSSLMDHISVSPGCDESMVDIAVASAYLPLGGELRILRVDALNLEVNARTLSTTATRTAPSVIKANGQHEVYLILPRATASLVERNPLRVLGRWSRRL